MKRQNITRRPDHFSSAFLDGSGTSTSPMKYATSDGSASVRQFRRRTSSVPWRHGAIEPSSDDDDSNVMRLRTFTIDPKAGKLINRGDSYRSLNNGSRSDSCAGSLESNSKDGILSRCQSPPSPVTRYSILVLGIEGVGKTVTINQFMTSDYCNFFTNEISKYTFRRFLYIERCQYFNHYELCSYCKHNKDIFHGFHSNLVYHCYCKCFVPLLIHETPNVAHVTKLHIPFVLLDIIKPPVKNMPVIYNLHPGSDFECKSDKYYVHFLH